MTQSGVRQITAQIIIFGHFLLFIIGTILLGLGGTFQLVDGVQIALMSCPVLAATALGAFKYVVESDNSQVDNVLVTPAFARVVIGIPILILCYFSFLIVASYFKIGSIGPDGIKIMVGAGETVFGAFLGYYGGTLFKTKSS